MRCLSSVLGMALFALALGAQAQVACKLSTQYLDVFLPGGGAFIPPGTSYQLLEGNSPTISMGVYCEGTGEFPPPTIAGATYVWSTGETSQRIDVPQPSPSGPSTYTVTVTSPAGRVVLGATIRGAVADAPRCTITTNAPNVVSPGAMVTLTAACSPQASSYSWDAREFLGYLSIVGSPNQQSVTVRFNGAQPGQVMPIYLIPKSGMTQGPFASYLLTAGNPAAQLPLNPPMVAGGGTSSCALTTAGGAKCWGDDGLGQLGDYRGASLYSTSPVNVIGAATGVTALALGRAHGCMLTRTGALHCWGDNAFGQLGDGSAKGSTFLTDVTGLDSGVASIFTGPAGDHTCALMSSGGLKCWGRNDVGQLGTGSRLAVFTPVGVSLPSPAVSMAAGGSHTCVAMKSGGVRCWGANGSGQLGDGATLDHLFATDVTGLGAAAISVVAGATHTCALLADHTVKCWGSNLHGEIGNASVAAAVTSPTSVAGLNGVTALSAGAGHTCALANGALLCWGRNSEGQLGDGSLVDRSVPVATTGMSSGVASVSAGGFHTCAVISGGGTTCWGLNGFGRLGDGTLAAHSAAQLVVGELGSGFLDLTVEDGFSPPADKVPVFPLIATGNLSDITAHFQVRPQDVGSSGKVYVFALAPASTVKNSAEEKAAHLGHVASNSADEPTQCVLAQLSASGQLKAVSAANLQPLLSGVFTSATQSATLIDALASAQSTGADFYLGYGPDPQSMLQNGTNRSVASTGAAGATTCQPQPPQTGWWWNPQEPGRGFSIEVQGNRLFYAAFHYDASGRATWNVSPGTTSLDGSYFSSDLYSVAGGQTLGGPYKAPSASKAGTLALVFANASHGTMVWPGGAVPIERMNLVPGGLDAPLQAGAPENGWWWNPGESGRGFFIEWQAGYADLAGYMYDDSGNPVWYITVDPAQDPRSLSGSWWSYADGQSMGGAYKPATQTSNNVAPVSVQFSAPDTALMTLPNGRTTALVRQRF